MVFIQQIKIPRLCSVNQLKWITREAQRRVFDFPYLRDEKRYATVADYEAELLLRKNEEKPKVKPKNPLATEFMDRLKALQPVLFAELELAIPECLKKGKAVQLALDPRDIRSRYFIAHMVVRAEIFRTVKCILVGAKVTEFWLLPDGTKVDAWVENKSDLDTAKKIERRYPKAVITLEFLAKDAKKSSMRCAEVAIDTEENLLQVVDVLSVYPHQRAIEQRYRVAFAFGNGNRVMARTLAARCSEFGKFISPESQLKAWENLR